VRVEEGFRVNNRRSYRPLVVGVAQNTGMRDTAQQDHLVRSIAVTNKESQGNRC
jgi:hypothetical protein